MPDENPIRAFYEQHPRMVSSPFGGVDSWNRELFLSVLNSLNITLTGKRVLDIGCGRGLVEEVVRDAGGAYLGMDFVCSRKGFPFLLGDAHHLPFLENRFDVVFCIDAFEHFPNPQRTAHEIYRVLTPGGLFFLSAPNYGNVAGLVKKYCEKSGAYAKDSWAPFGQWQPQELEQALTQSGVRRLFSRAGFSPIRRMGYGVEAGLGIFPWMDHPRMPDRIRFRLQRLFRACGPLIVKLWPGASLHLFWRMDKPA
ncbi:MAG TPA: methyltransferase domain-containing protein [Candidatus Hydrogenedentes bacterium]|nr:methyltransferase domain-containing protein [Candidatus Hydrogenedentota bacterium]